MKKAHSGLMRYVTYFVLSIGFSGLCFFLLLMLMPQPFYKSGFKTLEELESYAKMTNENIPLDTENTIKPDFDTYYKTLIPTWKTRFKEKCYWLLSLIKLKQTPLWSPTFFKTQIDDLAKIRESNGYKNNFVCKIRATPESKFIIFGNLQGALHSFTRDLRKLQTLDIINNDLKIINPHYYIIFLGDVVSRSPFSMETLSAVMKILQTNPNNIIYLRGNHESNNYWQEHTLKTELQIRAADLSKATIPLADEVNRFFNTLPLALYIIPFSSFEKDQLIRISYQGLGQNKLLQEESYSRFLLSDTEGYNCFDLKDQSNNEPNNTSIKIRAIIKGEKKREVYQPHEGIRLLEPDMGAIAWTILSCPTMTYRKAINFFYDAFVALIPAEKLDAWKMVLYNRDTRTKKPFKTTTYALLSGFEEGTEKKAPEIKIVSNSKASDKALENKPKKIVPPSLQTTETSTIATHAENIAQYAKTIAQEAQEIEKEMQPKHPENIQPPIVAPIKMPEKKAPLHPSAFQPIKKHEIKQQ